MDDIKEGTTECPVEVREDTNASPYTLMGDTYLMSHDFDKALAEYTMETKENPNNPLGHCGVGAAYYCKGDYGRALSSIAEAIRLKPNLALAYHYSGAVYFKKGDHEKAIADCKTALQIDPDLTETRKMLRIIELRSSQSDSIDKILADAELDSHFSDLKRPMCAKGLNSALEIVHDAIASWEGGYGKAVDQDSVMESFMNLVSALLRAYPGLREFMRLLNVDAERTGDKNCYGSDCGPHCPFTC